MLKVRAPLIGASLWVPLLVPTLTGCAFTYADANGDQHIIGIVDYTIRASAAPETVAGDVLEITSIGLSAGQNAQGGYFTAGFNRQASATLRDSSLVIGNPIAGLAPSTKTTEQ